jgi:lipid A 3-O-deacylase
MLPKLGRVASIMILGFLTAALSQASEEQTGDELRLTVGLTGALDRDRDATARIEYHFDKPLVYTITPYVSAGIATDGSSLFGAGLAYRRRLGSRWRMTLASGPAYYDRNGGADLGYNLEFVSYAELATEVAPGLWVGLNFGHISNAGLGKVNPGREIVGITYSIHFDELRRRKSAP